MALTHFWVFNHLNIAATASGDIRKIRLSDFAEVLTSITADVNQEDNEQADAPIPYTSDSCPIIEVVIDPVVDPSVPDPCECPTEHCCCSGLGNCCGSTREAEPGATGNMPAAIENSWDPGGITIDNPNGRLLFSPDPSAPESFA